MSVSALLAFVSFWEHMSLFVYNKNQSVEISQICLPFCKELCSCTLNVYEMKSYKIKIVIFYFCLCLLHTFMKGL